MIGRTGSTPVLEKSRRIIQPSDDISLGEINSSVPVPPAGTGFFKTLISYLGPGALVAVGYMDPGNWVTSIGGGAQYGYVLLSVVLLSSLVAMLLQCMSAKLGVVTGMDLAQATRAHTGRKLGFALWIVTELAIMATDIAEVIGAAIALHLLFGIPLTIGVIVTVLDVFLLLLLLKVGMRKIEALVVVLIATIMVIFVYQVILARPDIPQILTGFLPSPSLTHSGQLTMALGIVGATVMPHNLYLHSAIVQSRNYERTSLESKRQAVRFATIDSNLQLSVAFVINTLLLLLGAAMFYGRGSDLGTLGSVFDALKDSKIAGAVASPVLSILFAVALLASGQNSTITGTLTGQVVMEGFIKMRIPLWLRRVVTRVIAIIPVVICTIIFGGEEAALDNLLVYSQVFLCIALPISMVPLVWFTSSKKIMGEFANRKWAVILGWLATAVLTVLNIQLIWQTLSGLF
ncbi:divalent metal cation transporter [Acidipropionibacterium jensenii]|uniref:Nramp family divalent metal transporter n=1 Tax=Acidipropionibacterium jensenii TaxID=1749 RepID=UPI000BC324B5|nr:Nramp family divalent metal transporter [Acidipropionibacterium jensenii]AZZ42562.1 divalent metal cation transporter [Acidipropionibacterium jensenii]